MQALPEAGDLVAGYRIERPLGRGGMGVVYLAEQLRLRRLVALKLIVPELSQDDEFRRRFERESQLAASIDHPNVLPVYEAGESEGVLFISMRYVDGSDLRALIHREGRLDHGRATWLVAQLGAALDAAHAQGLVHRDVKPANVLVTGPVGSEHAYLTDFGLTKHVSSSSGLTHTGQWVGTLDYVAPEQISGGALDARVDIYSLGCVLFEALTGRVPYPKDSDVAKMYAHLNEPPARVSQLVAGLSPAFDGVIERALAKVPSDRYPSAGDLGRAGIAAADGQANTVPERTVAAGGAAPSTTRQHYEVAAPAPAPPAAPAADPSRGPTARLPVPPPPGWVPPPALPTPPSPSGGHSRWPIVAVAATVLALAGIAAALVAAGVLGTKRDKSTTVIIRNRVAASPAAPQTAPGNAGPGATSTQNPPPTTPSSGSTDYSSNTYAAQYPAGWSVAEDNVDMGAHSETKFKSPDGTASVLIDRTPGAPLDPQAEAAGVEQETSRTRGYQRVAFQATTIAGRPGFKWAFDLPSGRRVDYFTDFGGGRFAVLGYGSDFPAASAAALAVAESLR